MPRHWNRVLAAVLALVFTACVPQQQASPTSIPDYRQGNVMAVNGSGFYVVPAAMAGEPSLNDWTASGLQTPEGPECGDEVRVSSSSGQKIHGRIILFQHHQGQGPAGRGQYLIEVPDARIESARQGRLSMHSELYRAKGSIWTAWVAVLSDRPIACQQAPRRDGAPPRIRTISTSRPPVAPDGSAWATLEQCEARLANQTRLYLAQLDEFVANLEALPPTEREAHVEGLELLADRRVARHALEIVSAPANEREATEQRIRGLYGRREAMFCTSSTAPVEICLAEADSLEASTRCYPDLVQCTTIAWSELESRACVAAMHTQPVASNDTPATLKQCLESWHAIRRAQNGRMEELAAKLARLRRARREAFVGNLEAQFDRGVAQVLMEVAELPRAKRQERVERMQQAMDAQVQKYLKVCRRHTSSQTVECIEATTSPDGAIQCEREAGRGGR